MTGATAFFSWPSNGGGLDTYWADEAAVEACEPLMAQFLSEFVRNCKASKVHLIAHSMGNRGLLRSLQRIAADVNLATGVKFGQIFLAAPDVDQDVFLDLATHLSRFSERTTLYASQRDVAVAASMWIHDNIRAGYLPPVTVATGNKQLNTIVIPDFNLDLIGHSYYAEADALLNDIFNLMAHDAPPEKRQRIDPENDHWIMRR